jgi:hypothetical protein
MLRKRIKTFCKLLLANILIFLVVGIIIEIGGQTYAYFHPAYKVIPFAPHPVLGWRFIPNTEHIITGNHWYAREFSAKVKINSHGFRDLERKIEKKNNTIRVALLGDSMVAARQLNFEKTAGQLLEKRLNKEFGPKTGKKYEVLNFGVPGYGVDQMFLNWDRYASKFNPDYVFLYIFEKNYLRTISSNWCARGFLGIDNLGDKKCLFIRPVAYLRKQKVNRKKLIGSNPNMDLFYINDGELKNIKEILKRNSFNDLFSYLNSLPTRISPPLEYIKFLKEQKIYIEKEMNGTRMIKKKTKLFLYDIFLSANKSLISFFDKKKQEDWRDSPHYTSGNTNNFPSWITTNLVNLKTLQVLGNSIISSRNNFTIVDSFQFHNESIPPTQFASKWLRNLSKYSNFGYIPLYEKLNKSNQNGNSPRWKYDAHLNELGNQIFADSMFDYLEKKLN